MERFELFDDGHKPGGEKNKAPTELIVNSGKSSSNFLITIDDLIPDDWCDRIYSYAFKRSKPWGTYISTSDALDLSKSADDLWEDSPEAAIGLLITRLLVFEGGKNNIAGDIGRIAGMIKPGTVYIAA
jgi:hypothetical protein